MIPRAAEELQNNAIKNTLRLLGSQDKVVFQAPTGSGKTFMMAKIMDEILKKDPDCIFLVSTRSTGSLGAQNYDKFVTYKSKLHNLNPYLIDNGITASDAKPTIPDKYNVYVIEMGLLQSDGLLIKSGSFARWLTRMTSADIGGKNKKLYWIKDESHIATNKLSSMLIKKASKILEMSATPDKGDYVDVKISDEEAVRDKLIKAVSNRREENVRAGQHLTMEEELEMALKEFVEIKADYAKHIKHINPCMLIQISNESKGTRELNKIKAILSLYPKLTWVSMIEQKDGDKIIPTYETNDKLGASKFNNAMFKKYVKEDSSHFDIVIFKLVVNVGWDVPRACVLYQVRDTKSSTLDTQTIGRVRRNPILNNFDHYSDEAKAIATKAFIWADEKNPTRKINLVDVKTVQQEIQIATTEINKEKIKRENPVTSKHITKHIDENQNISLFQLYDAYCKADDITKAMCDEYATSYEKWLDFMVNIKEIKTSIKDYVEKQGTHLKKNKDGSDALVSLPAISSFTETDFMFDIENWVWDREDGKCVFAFDSEAERSWVKQFVKITRLMTPSGTLVQMFGANISEEQYEQRYLWAKNYIVNSELYFEYYDNNGGTHKSYPDFIMKDGIRGDIHIFETKSLNVRLDSKIDATEYKNKIDLLKKCYMEASKLVDYIFYIPIQKDDGWEIHIMHKGKDDKFDDSADLSQMRSRLLSGRYIK